VPILELARPIEEEIAMRKRRDASAVDLFRAVLSLAQERDVLVPRA